jgi:hypothetical protein
MKQLTESSSARRHRQDKITIAAMRARAFNHGYALAVHGSQGPKNLDLVAVAWTPNAGPVEILISHLTGPELCISHKSRLGEMPHGRLVYTLVRMHDHRIVDLSIIPPQIIKIKNT